MKRTSILSTLLLTFFVSFLSIGCDDDVKKNDNNNNVNNTNNATCGNNLLETGETCDGTDLGGQDCTTVEGDFTGGTLACAAGCGAFDTVGCTTGCSDACELDNRVCSGDTLRVCEANIETGCTVWVDTDCTSSSETCQVIDTVAQCADCVDACVLNEERCNDTDDGIEACVLGAAGCTEWQNADCPQATPACELVDTIPTCVATCEDACTLAAKQCNLTADGIEVCVTGAEGCTEWQNNPCDAGTPQCQDIDGTPTCMMPNGSGDSCSDVYTITVPFYTEGADFVADFPTIDMTLTAASCDTYYSTATGVDGVFAVDLLAGEVIVFQQGGGLDGGIFIQDVCDGLGECLEAQEYAGSNGVEEILFEATADGTYYLTVKSWSASPSTVSYQIAVFYYEDLAELSCDDGFDNDLDDLFDCEDPDCYGLGLCIIETVCDDGDDNDNDGDIDCADADCAGIAPCGPENTADTCGDAIDNDNDGDTDCADTDCANLGSCGPENTVAFCADGLDNDNDGMIDCMDTDCNGVGACGPENTEAFCADGLDNDADGLADCYDTECASLDRCQSGESCATPQVITLPFSVSGANFGLDYVNNHNFYNTAGGCSTANGAEGIFAVTLTAGQQIRMDETNSSFDAVIRVLGACTDVNPTCLISSDSTETNLRFTAPADGTYFIILEAYYASAAYAYNFSVFTVAANEVGLCADGFDNDSDGKTDCNDTDCFGAVGACETESNCSDAGDNDGDTFVDCDDDDCATALNCLGGDSCADALPVALPFNATGTDITADFTNAQTFTGTGCTSGSGVEAVFTVALTAGQRIKMDETGTLDAVIRVVEPCANATTCLLNKDTPETNLVFTAPADGVYYVVLEAYSLTPSTSYRGYNFSIVLLPETETNCADTLDDDLDGKFDCNDPDCFGETGCTVELNCADGFDNDDDGFADCADMDCAAATACELGEGCANPTVVTTFPFNVFGTNFGADFANDHTFTSATCTTTAAGADAVFAVELTAGQKLRLNEPGALDAVFRVLPVCTTTSPVCLLSTDSESNILYTATADGTYYVILEAYYASTTSAYNFTIEKFDATETNCADGIDNDLDTFRDCADADCAGVGACGPEDTDTACGDTLDNDGDGLTDCADAGCTAFCATVFSENFTGGLPADWAISGTVWAVGTPTAGPASCPSAPNCAGTNLGGTYPNNMAWDAHCLTSGTIDLTGLTSAALLFQSWWHTESGAYDGGRVQVFHGGAWVNPATVSPTYTGTVGSQLAWYSIAQTWLGHSVVLTPYVGGPIQVRFCFRSDTSGVANGWFLDDVSVIAN